MSFVEILIATCSIIANLVLFLFGLSLAGLGGLCVKAGQAGQAAVGVMMVLFGLFLCVMAGKNIWNRVTGAVDTTPLNESDSPFSDN